MAQSSSAVSRPCEFFPCQRSEPVGALHSRAPLEASVFPPALPFSLSSKPFDVRTRVSRGCHFLISYGDTLLPGSMTTTPLPRPPPTPISRAHAGLSHCPASNRGWQA